MTPVTPDLCVVYFLPNRIADICYPFLYATIIAYFCQFVKSLSQISRDTKVRQKKLQVSRAGQRIHTRDGSWGLGGGRLSPPPLRFTAYGVGVLGFLRPLP